MDRNLWRQYTILRNFKAVVVDSICELHGRKRKNSNNELPYDLSLNDTYCFSGIQTTGFREWTYLYGSCCLVASFCGVSHVVVWYWNIRYPGYVSIMVETIA